MLRWNQQCEWQRQAIKIPLSDGRRSVVNNGIFYLIDPRWFEFPRSTSLMRFSKLCCCSWYYKTKNISQERGCFK
jgi:hypothetical protein